MYVWLNSPLLAIDRVNKRKIKGGHFLSDDVIKHRYERSCNNLFNFYLPLADGWLIYDNSESDIQIIADSKLNTINEARALMMGNKPSNKISEPENLYDRERLHKMAKAAIREELDRRHKLNLPIVFMHEGKIITIEGKDLYNYLDKEKKDV